MPVPGWVNLSWARAIGATRFVNKSIGSGFYSSLTKRGQQRSCLGDSGTLHLEDDEPATREQDEKTDQRDVATTSKPSMLQATDWLYTHLLYPSGISPCLGYESN